MKKRLTSILGLEFGNKNTMGDIYDEEIPVKRESRFEIENRKKSQIVNTDNSQEKTYDFHGAILGKSRCYAKKAYPLQEKTRIFIIEDGCEIIVDWYKNPKALAALYYISEYQEYCIEVFSARNIFLHSGQPLGARRTYYLPRGTEIYVIDEENRFELA